MSNIILNNAGALSFELPVSLGIYKDLKDHAFQDMVVLPGSFYIEAAYEIFQKELKHAEFDLTDVSFINLFFLSEKDQTIYAELGKTDSGYDLIFSNRQGNSSENLAKISAKISENSFIKNPYKNLGEKIISSDSFYEKLDKNKNQYGQSFRVLNNIKISEDLASAELNIKEDDLKITKIMDAASHLLSCFSYENNSTYLLKDIGSIEIIGDIKKSEKVFARLIKVSSANVVGDVYLINEQNEVLGIIENLNLQYLEDTKKNKFNLNIAATYTADNLNESLQLWGNEFDIDLAVNFAPYNQIFQELLDPESSFSKNKNGFNVILIKPDDWEKENNNLSLKVSEDQKAVLLKDISSHVLANNIEIAQLNKYETEYVFNEIFVDKSYLKHGIKISDNDTIIDIGANIGLFSLFMEEQAKNLNIFSYEPSPPVYKLLETNAKLYGTNIKTFNCGISDRSKTAEFTFYEKSSVFSGFQTNTEDDREAIQAVVENMLKDNSIEDSKDIQKFVSEIMEDRLKSAKYTCRLKSVTDIIEENNIKNINLLKVDAEKSELPILQGIKDEHWKIIDQIVIEVHDKIGNVISEIKSILTEKGFTFAIEEEKLLHNSGLYNIFAVKKSYKNNTNDKNAGSHFDESLNSFTDILIDKAAKSRSIYMVFLSPVSPGSNISLDKVYNKLNTSFSSISNIYVYSHNNLDELYKIANIHDHEGNKLGHVPYTKKYFAAVGTFLIRRILSIINSPYKVVAIDCDNTLWEGVCGEDGALGVQIKNHHKILQKKLLRLIEQGKIICLNSKNNEADVWEVFAKNKDMILKREDIVSSRLNWNSKSDNLMELAIELNLGLDSFIFIDDNPVECAEIKAKLPEVLTIQIPKYYDIDFINNIWAFDSVRYTDEDRKRTQLYIQEKERKSFKQKVTLHDFINGLNLNIQIIDPLKENISRISQLTYRTNQFNFTTIRRPETEISHLLNSDSLKAKIFFVSDRFGDYGLVGLTLFSFTNSSLNIDTFLLSCRVLGRGVEYGVMAELGKIATENNLENVILKFIPTKKNKPALNFADKIGSDFKVERVDAVYYNFPADFLKDLKYKPSEDEYDERVENISEVKSTKNILDSEKSLKILAELNSIENILLKIEQKIDERKLSHTEYIAPGGENERKIAEIWQNVLGLKKVGINDNFFELGGTSLKGVQVISRMKKEFNREISIVNLFEFPTISKMRSFIEKEDVQPEANEESRSRGERRREIISSRRERRKS